MKRANFDLLLERVNSVPTPPKVIRELMAECEVLDADIDRIAFLLGSDPVLAAKILKLANSAFYARKPPVSRLHEAVIFVGTHATRNLAMSVGLASMIRFPAGFPTQSFWSYSVNCAAATQYLAKEARQDPGTGFALGLIRGIGLPICAAASLPELPELDAICPFYDYARTTVERDRLGFSHIELSVALAERWSFPGDMVASLRQSDVPSGSAEGAAMGAVMAAGAWLAGEHEWTGKAPEWIPDHVERHLRVAKLQKSVFDEMPPLKTLSAGSLGLVS